VAGRIDVERLAEAWSTAMDLRERIAATAVSIAETEDWVADTLDHLARVRPREAVRLRARAQRARLFAARERAQAALYRSGPGTAHILDLSPVTVSNALSRLSSQPVRCSGLRGSGRQPVRQPGRGPGPRPAAAHRAWHPRPRSLAAAGRGSVVARLGRWVRDGLGRGARTGEAPA
jgi:hypothetical protein